MRPYTFAFVSSLVAVALFACAPKNTVPVQSTVRPPSEVVVAFASALPPATTVLQGKPVVPSEPANLLDIVPATLAVSSTVTNPHDFPEHLIDGKPETAWNSKTGDLRGFIAFRVPKDVRVDEIQLTAGFTKVTAKEDLFTANHRIKRVAVSRDGVLLKEVDIDPTVRSLQSISIDGPGGDYKVEVKDTVPGTRKDWKELVVSEFRVVGKPGEEKREPNQPLVVAIKTLDQEDESPLGIETSADIVSHKSVKAVCDAWIRGIDHTGTLAMYSGLKPTTPSCTEAPVPVAFAPVGIYKSVHAVKLNNGIGNGMDLVLETSRGFFLLGVDYHWENPLDPGCPSIVRIETVEELRVDNGYFVVVVGGTRGAYVTPTSPSDSDGYRYALSRTAFWAKDDGKQLSTKFWNPQFHPDFGIKIQAHSPLQIGKNGQNIAPPSAPWSSLPWKDFMNFRITPSGVLQVQP
jgi:hypothetical protein